MNRLQWPRAQRSIWLTRIGAIVVTLAAFGIGTTWDRGEAIGNIGLATKIAMNSHADAGIRLQAMTSMRRDILAAMRVFDALKDDPLLGPHAENFSRIDDR